MYSWCVVWVGFASPSSSVIVAVAKWVVAAAWGSISLVGGWGREGIVKMKYNFCFTSFL